MSHLKIFDDSSTVPVIQTANRPNDVPGRRGAFFALAVVLIVWAIEKGFNGPEQAGRPASLWDLGNVDRLRELASGWLSEIAWQVTYSLQAGLCAALLVGSPLLKPGWRTGATRALIGGLAVAMVLTGGFSTTWDPVLIMLPLLACLIGVWIGLSWLSGLRARTWLVPQALLGLGLMAALMLGLWQSVRETTAIASNSAPLTLAEKRRLWELFRNETVHSPVLFKDFVRLTEADVNDLLAWAFELVNIRGAAQMTLEPSHWSGNASLPLPGNTENLIYLNVRSQGRLGIADGRLQLVIEKLQLGRLAIPGYLVSRLSHKLETALNLDPDARAMVQAIESLRVSAGEVNIVAPGGKLGTELVPRLLARSADQTEIVPAVQAQLRYLIALVPRLPRGDARFDGLLRAAFLLARDRSHAGSEPLENRAAILALGILAGHHHLAEFVGPVLEGDLRQWAMTEAGSATLRGRADWARHFYVSGGLALLSGADLADAIGLFKEELDSDGGSGFSFADLLADRAGARFALAATRDADAARAMQERVAERLDIGDFFPPAENLPEGIPEATFQAEYGGIGGARYRLVENELNRRLDRCPALR